MQAPFRRIVTGHDQAGKAIIQEDGPPPRVQRIGGEAGPLFYEVWNTIGTPVQIDRASGEPAETGIVLAPPKNGTRIRVLDIVSEQTRALRRRALMDNFKQSQHAGSGDPQPAQPVKQGTYWGIRTRIDAYGVPALTHDNEKTGELQNVRTRLNEFNPREQGRLINWGYALTDAAMRKYVDQAPAIGTWPVPEHRLDN